MLAHIHPSSLWFTVGLSPNFKSKGYPAQSPDPAQDRQVPRAALPTSGVTIGRSKSSLLSEGVTPPSSLILAHAPDQNPPLASLCKACTKGLCRLLPVPAGSWPFPTLSLQSVLRCLDPYPAASVRCFYPFLPRQLRPHLTRDRFGTRNTPCTTTSHRGAHFGAAVIR